MLLPHKKELVLLYARRCFLVQEEYGFRSQEQYVPPVLGEDALLGQELGFIAVQKKCSLSCKKRWLLRKKRASFLSEKELLFLHSPKVRHLGYLPLFACRCSPQFAIIRRYLPICRQLIGILPVA